MGDSISDPEALVPLFKLDRFLNQGVYIRGPEYKLRKIN